MNAGFHLLQAFLESEISPAEKVQPGSEASNQDYSVAEEEMS